MLTHLTDGADAAGAYTGIHALIAHTSLVAGTVRVQYTLGTTTHIGITLELGQTRALSIIADCIGATRRGIAGIMWCGWCVDGWWWLGSTANEGITLIASGAAADGRVLDDVALRRDAT